MNSTNNTKHVEINNESNKSIYSNANSIPLDGSCYDVAVSLKGNILYNKIDVEVEINDRPVVVGRKIKAIRKSATPKNQSCKYFNV